MDILKAGITELKAGARREVIKLANQAYLIDTVIGDLIKNEIDFIEVVEYLTIPQLSSVAPLIFNVYGNETAEASLVITTKPNGINYMIIDKISQSSIENVENINLNSVNQIIQDYMQKYVKI